MKFFNVKKILIPLDFSKSSLKAVDYAVKIANVAKAEIILVHITAGYDQNLQPDYFSPPPALALLDYQKEFVKQSAEHLEALAVKIKAKGISNVKSITTIGDIHDEILRQAKENKVDLIVMGTHGVSGFREFFAGSNTFRVIRDAKCPVLSIPQKANATFLKNILMPFRDKPHSREKVNYAFDLSLMFSSTVHVLGIDDEFTKTHKNKILLEAEQIKKLAQKHGVPCKTKIISDSYIGDVVIKYAQSVNADLIISMADLDKMNITEYFTGPFAQQIVNHSTIPVLSVRPKFNTDTIDLRFY